jgi:PAP2 superfamily protein
MRPIERIALLCALVALASACDSDQRLAGPGTLKLLTANASGVPFTEGLASPAWQATARNFIMQSKLSGNSAASTRVYAYLSVAQHDAVVRAEDAIAGEQSGAEPASEEGLGSGGRSRLEADRGAVAGASAVVLTYFDPADAQLFENQVQQQANAGPGQPNPDFIRGEAVGRQVGAEAIARARTDGFDLPWTGTVPVGTGLWFSSAKPPQPPANAQLPGMRPFFLTSPNQFRPKPPPAFGSPAYLPVLAEVRSISDTRTAEQVSIALFWARGAGTTSIGGLWNTIATGWIEESALGEREATHVFALLDAAMMDAAIGCWDAKLTYWFIRPPQADRAITLIPAIGLPNHPSYPSAHSCYCGAAAGILSTFFPAKTDSLDAMVTQAGLARIYAGIHYRFDVDTGAQLGRNVARFASKIDRARSAAAAVP